MSSSRFISFGLSEGLGKDSRMYFKLYDYLLLGLLAKSALSGFCVGLIHVLKNGAHA